MKNTKSFLLGFAVLGIMSAFTLRQSNAIKGSVTPADKAVKAVAILSNARSDKDSISAPISNGSFEFQNLKAGDYTVVIEAEAPYGNRSEVGVSVHNGQTTDLGQIQLEQK